MRVRRDALHSPEQPLNLEGTLFELGIEGPGDSRLPVRVELTAREQGEEFHLEGTVRTRLVATCDRCLDDVRYPVEGGFEVWLVSEQGAAGRYGTAEVVVFPTDQAEVDLRGVISETIYLEIPSKVLCQADCRGICPSCGVNQNWQQCICKDQKMDERWSALREIKEQLQSE